ncbi:MAG: 3-dehydroquinate synthase [Candidatus Eisenbacteria bacterium]|jgi:3-dehydroquinate synthetase|nr:3-dehydroquinate synthase [Candidatus Eisenbacteria bacterium]
MVDQRVIVGRREPVFAYPLLVADELPPRWACDVAPVARCRGNAILAFDGGLPAMVVEPVEAALRDCLGERLSLHQVAAGESLKSVEALLDLYRVFSRSGVRRDGIVLAFGGGTVGDTVGFAAATWHRGVPWVPLPTTLLAQVDSAIGGKVGANLGGFKNQIGSFHQPSAVVVDIGWLAYLPESALVSGMGEVIKYAVGFDPYLWGLLVCQDGPVSRMKRDLLARIVRRCIELKARLVALDERDLGPRRLLNLGHTFAHALEGSGACLDHGSAVGLGVLAASRLGIRLGLCDPQVEGDLVTLMIKLGMAVNLEGSVPAALMNAWDADKKHRAIDQIVVVPTGRGSCRVVLSPPGHMVREVTESLFAPL